MYMNSDYTLISFMFLQHRYTATALRLRFVVRMRNVSEVNGGVIMTTIVEITPMRCWTPVLVGKRNSNRCWARVLLGKINITDGMADTCSGR